MRLTTPALLGLLVCTACATTSDVDDEIVREIEVEDTTAPPVDADGDGYVAAEDCDDADPSIHPAAEERCDGADNDCDGRIDVDATDALLAFEDADEDGFGGGEGVWVCELGPLDVDQGGDCDDEDPAIHPDAIEVCDPDNVDEDCDGRVDDADDSVDPSTMTTWYRDADEDGWGNSDDALLACDGLGRVSNDIDCDDSDASLLDCPHNGTYSGEMHLHLLIPALPVDGKCTMTADFVVDQTASPAISGEPFCIMERAEFFGPFEGEFTGENTAAGTFNFSSIKGEWTGEFTEDGTFDITIDWAGTAIVPFTMTGGYTGVR